MLIRRISISQFKNIYEADLSFSSRLNCFVGNNGAGKTNLLDALYMLAMCKSYFSLSDIQNVRNGENYFSIKGFYERGDDNIEIFCGFTKGTKKSFKKNNKPYERLADHIGVVPLVIVSPEDIVLVEGGSEERRKWLDSVISQYDSEYLRLLIKYNKVLQQRNSIIKSSSNYIQDDSLLDVWNMQLVDFGEKIHAKRATFIEQFSDTFNKYYKCISLNRDSVNLKYKSTLFSEQSFELQLKESLNRDLILGYTTIGIHRDDLVMNIGNFPIKKQGSQGQKKSFLIALKLAQYEWLYNNSGIKPILLLDDIFDKLDSDRVREILSIVGQGIFGQVFITDTNSSHIDDLIASFGGEYKIFYVNHGQIE